MDGGWSNEPVEKRGAPDHPLPIGSRVRVQGLVNNANYNGKHARVLSFNVPTGRYAVELENGEKRVLKSEFVAALLENIDGPRSLHRAVAPASCAAEERGRHIEVQEEERHEEEQQREDQGDEDEEQAKAEKKREGKEEEEEVQEEVQEEEQAEPCCPCCGRVPASFRGGLAGLRSHIPQCKKLHRKSRGIRASQQAENGNCRPSICAPVFVAGEADISGDRAFKPTGLETSDLSQENASQQKNWVARRFGGELRASVASCNADEALLLRLVSMQLSTVTGDGLSQQRSDRCSGSGRSSHRADAPASCAGGDRGRHTEVQEEKEEEQREDQGDDDEEQVNEEERGEQEQEQEPCCPCCGRLPADFPAGLVGLRSHIPQCKKRHREPQAEDEKRDHSCERCGRTASDFPGGPAGLRSHIPQCRAVAARRRLDDRRVVDGMYASKNDDTPLAIANRLGFPVSTPDEALARARTNA